MDNTIANNTTRSILLTVLAVLMITAMAGSASAAITYVTVTSPNGGENWSGTQTIEWTVGGFDPESSFRIGYSGNGGLDWVDVVVGISGTERSWDTTGYSDKSTHRIKVTAYNTTVTIADDTSNSSFTIDNTNPTVAIDTPTDGQNVSSDTIWINGTYSDATSYVDNSSLVVKIDGTEVTGGTNTSGYYNYSATISSLSEGSHGITVDVNDFAVNTGQGTSSFTVDQSAPTFSIKIPTGNITGSTPWINATFGDGSGTGVNASATVLIVNGTDKTVSTTVNNDTDIAYEVESALADGTIAVNISITDYMGNTTWGNWTFVVDTGLPTLGTLDTPTEDDNVSTSTVWINGTYTDTGSGVNTSSLVVKVNGSVPAFDSPNRTSGYYNYSITLPDGSHNVTVDVSDYAGNDAAQKLVNFTVDAEAPTFSICIPTGNSTDSTPWINATFADDGTGVNVSATTVTVNGTDVTSSLTVNTSTNVSYHANLNDSTHTVNVSITDYTGNTTWGNWTFVVDTGLPTLGTLDTPTEDDNVSTSTVWINGTYTDTGSGVNTSSLVVKVNGSVPAFDSPNRTSGYYNYSITLPDGSHNVTVDVSDYAGNDAAQKLVNFTVDAEAPTFSICIPTGNSTDSTPWINATFADDGTGVNVSATTVTVNGTDVTSSLTVNTSTNVSYHANLNDSTHTVNVSITDYTGNTTWGNWTFVVDNVVPTLVLDLPTADQNVSTSTVWINGTYTDATSGVNTSSLAVKVNGSASGVSGTTGGAITSGYYNYSITLPDGSHNVTVDVSDYAGNAAAQKLVNFTVDTQAPDVTANPTAYPGTQSAAKIGDAVILNATVIDAGSGVSSVMVNASTINNTQTSVTLTQVGSTNYYTETVIVGTSSGGVMYCAVNATDNRGYSNTSISLSVIVGNTTPSTPVVTDEGASTTSTTQLNATWSSDSESGIAEYFYAIGTSVGGTEIVDWTSTGTTAGVNKTGLTLTAGQTYYFTVKAQNGAGDNSTAGNSDGITVLTSATTSYDINLVPGWNMVSTPLMPDNTSIEAVLDGMTKVTSVYAYDALNDWSYHIPGYGGDLVDITAENGYWIQMSGPETLTINGLFLGPGGATPPTYYVYAGWNLVGFHSLSTDIPYDYLSNVRGDYASKMYGYGNGAWVTVNNADVVTGTDELEHGYGYWLYMRQNGTITP